MSWVQNNSHYPQQQQSPPPAVPYFGKTINTAITNNNNNNNNDNALNNPMNPALHMNNLVNNASMAYNNSTGALMQTPQQQQSYGNTTQNHLGNHQNISQQQLSTPQQGPPMQPVNSVMPQTANNNWQQQPHNQNVTTANVYQRQTPQTTTKTNNWQHNAGTGSTTQSQQQQPTFSNYYAQSTPTTSSVSLQQQPQPQQQQNQQQYPQHDVINYFQQNAPSTVTLPQHQQKPQLATQPTVSSGYDYFDIGMKSNNNNANSNINSQTDGWSDWDWNDNSNNVVIKSEVEQQQQQQQQNQQQQHMLPQSSHNHLPQQPTKFENQHQQTNLQPAYNSIEDSFSNDNWNWNVNEEKVLASNNSSKVELPKSELNPAPSNATPSNTQVSSSNVPHLVAHSKPTTLPLAETTNDNYNDLKGDVAAVGGATTNASNVTSAHNIPNSVYVSQAKPVTRPTRQYASPPGGNTPTVELPESALTPPQAFQNETEAASGVVQIQTSTMGTQLPQSTVLPPPGAIGGATAGSNPFKRSGAAQHHRAIGLLPTTTSLATVGPTAALPTTTAPMTSIPFNTLPPPPPADFANPMPIPLPLTDNLESGENFEDLHENQEVLAPPPPLPYAVTMHTTTLPGGNAIASPPLPPPPNDERNQYMQTSQLSENPDEELNIEADSLPPPGLSRLVLGQPEFGATQRLVTGTEEPNALSVTMSLDERQADGEDTSDEQPVGQVPVTVMPATDRNLYLVPGESNNTNVQQRVVTGVEMTADINMTAPPSNEQREIVLDGENLEDQQQVINTAAIRNEPPLEGAASGSDVQIPVSASILQVEAQSSTILHTSKSTRDNSNMSTGNDDESDGEQHARYMLSKKANKQSEIGKSERQRKDKQRSADRYETEDSLEYSSEREQDRERDRERRRGYREGSNRSERGGDDREYQDMKRRSDKQGDSDERKQRDKYYYRGTEATRSERRSQRSYQQRYDNDSRYETEESTTRHESSRKDAIRRSIRGAPAAAAGQPADERSTGARSDRSERDYDDYRQRYQRSSKRDKDIERERRSGGGTYDEDRREQRRPRQRNDRDDFDTTLERQRRRHYRGADPRADAREYDEYRKHSSRSARDSDLEKDRLRDPRDMRGYDQRHAAMYGYQPAAYGYDPYTAYYYEQMARTNPQAYAELYKKYYGQAPPASALGGTNAAAAGSAGNSEHTLGATTAATDGRESVHSGRSSAHNDKERSGNLSLRDADPILNEPQRLTPCKFNSEHAVVSFSSGVLVTFKPKYTSHGHISNIVKLLRLNLNDATRQLFQSFPGPLVRGLTHKKTIIEFCEEQIRLGPMQTTIFAKQLLSSNVEKYRASYTLMWNLLILLLRQNGMVVGTDIAELLLKNQQQFPYQPNLNQTPNLSASTSRSTKSDSQEEASGDNSESEDVTNELLNDEESLAQKNSSDSELSAKIENEDKPEPEIATKQLTDVEITEKFRNYLLYGNVNEALDWATDNNLWGHALFLASKVDRRLHANVMMKFANKLALNDPLQTLYQLMSGRTPSSVTSIQDEKWGDWRPHLSMILSNTSQKPELDRKAITTLGDSLFNRGDLFAAHFCYLMAQVGFGRYQDNAATENSLQQNLPKLVLLGSSHYKPFHEFASTEAIIMTEIYEYACSLNDEKFSIVEFQPYKFLLAVRQLDYGNHLKSLMYLEQIALHVQRDPSKYEDTLIHKIYELADRLKYYDPVLEKYEEDTQNADNGLITSGSGVQQLEEQKWLQELRVLVTQQKFDYASAATAMQSKNELYNQSTVNSYQVQNPIDQQFMEINKQFNELNLQYANNNENMVVPTFNNNETMQSQHHPEQQPQFTVSDGNQQITALPAVDQQVQQTNYNADPVTDIQDNNSQAVSDTYTNYQYNQPLEQQYQQNSYYDPTQQLQQQQYGFETTDQNNVANNSTYDYWTQQQQQQQQFASDENAARPTISMPKSKTFDSDDELQKQAKQTQNSNSAQQQQPEQRGKNESKEASKGSNQNSGWFGGIWNKLSLKPKNQMILPDDKNPTIVWDSEKKRWVNTDGGDDHNEESLKPPPKMSDIMPQHPQQQQQQQQQHMQTQSLAQQQIPQQSYQTVQPDANYMNVQQPQQQQQQPAVPLHNTNAAPIAATPANVPTLGSSGMSLSNYSASAANAGTPSSDTNATKPPSLQSNMFKMQRNRTLKNSYVDVFNPSGKPISKEVENVLAPTLPPVTVPQSGFFIPGAPVATQNDNAAYQQQQQQDAPQFYNPNQFSGGSGY